MQQKDRHLLRIWNEVTNDNPKMAEAELHATTLEIYNNSYPNNPADDSDLAYALERLND